MCQLFQYCRMEITWSPDLKGLSFLGSHLESGKFYFCNLTAANHLAFALMVNIPGLLNPSTNHSIQLLVMLGFCSFLSHHTANLSFSPYSEPFFSYCSFWFLRLKKFLPFPVNISPKVSLSLACANYHFIPVFLDFLSNLGFGKNFLPFSVQGLSSNLCFHSFEFKS